LEAAGFGARLGADFFAGATRVLSSPPRLVGGVFGRGVFIFVLSESLSLILNHIIPAN